MSRFFPSWLSYLFIDCRAVKDAIAAYFDVWTVIRHWTGRADPFDPANNPLHRRIQDCTRPEQRLSSWKAKIEEGGLRLAQRLNVWLAAALLVFFYVVEFFADLQLIKPYVSDPLRRDLLALGLAAIFFLIAEACAKLSRQDRPERSVRFWLLNAFILLVTLGVTLLQVDATSSGEESSSLVRWAIGIVLALAVVGNAAFGAIVFGKLATTWQLVRERNHYRRLIKRALRDQTIACGQEAYIRASYKAWEHAAQRVAGRYQNRFARHFLANGGTREELDHMVASVQPPLPWTITTETSVVPEAPGDDHEPPTTPPAVVVREFPVPNPYRRK